MARIVMTTLGTAGDVPPFIEIGHQLKKRGHQVYLLTHAYYEKLAAQAGVQIIPIDTPGEFDSYVRDLELLNRASSVPDFFRRQILPRMYPEFERLKALCQPAADTVLLARSTPGLAARMAAELFGVPLISVFIAPSQIATMPLIEQLLKTFIGTEVNQLRAEFGLPAITDWHDWLNLPRRNLALWPDWFAVPEAGWPPNVVPVGFLASDAAEGGDIPIEAAALLDENHPPVLITGGTGYMQAEFYTSSAEACHLLGQKALLVTRHNELVPQSLPAEVTRFTYLPFAAIMPRVAAVIHHGGAGTMIRATLAGTPQLILPAGNDRPANADLAQKLGIARWLLPGQLQPAHVASVLKEMLASHSLRMRCHEIASRARQTDAAQTACKVIEDEITAGTVQKKTATAPTQEKTNPGPAQTDDALRQRLEALSPEKRALMAARLKKAKEGAQKQ